MKDSKTASLAKLMLFGEYAVLHDGQALTIPLSWFKGQFEFKNKETDHRLYIASNYVLKKFSAYLTDNAEHFSFLNLNAFNEHINYGLHYNSNIPMGYGVGSSGALVASVYKRYLVYNKTHVDLLQHRKNMAQMERFFHGESSGTDPLACFVAKPLWFTGRTIKTIDSALPKQFSVYLYDLNKVAETKGFVRKFKSELKHNKQTCNLFNEYVRINNQCLNTFITNDTGFLTHIKKLSELQLKLFPDMLTHEGIDIVKNGLRQDSYFAKLCGSGGGGYLLVFKNNNELNKQNDSRFIRVI